MYPLNELRGITAPSRSPSFLNDNGVYELIRTTWSFDANGRPVVLEQKAVGAITDSSGFAVGRLIDGVLYAPLDRGFLRAAGVSLAALDKAASPWEVTLTLPGAPAAVRFDAAPEGADNFNTERR